MAPLLQQVQRSRGPEVWGRRATNNNKAPQGHVCSAVRRLRRLCIGHLTAASKLISQQGLQNYRRQRRPFLAFPDRDGRDGLGTNRFTREVISIRTFVKAAPRGKGRIDVQHDVALSRQQIAAQIGACSEKM